MALAAINIYEILKKVHTDDDAGMMIGYLEDGIDVRINDRIDLKLMNLATKEDISFLNTRLTETKSDLEVKIGETKSGLEVKLAEARSGIIKWMFVFWVTQMATIFGFLIFLLSKLP